MADEAYANYGGCDFLKAAEEKAESVPALLEALEACVKRLRVWEAHLEVNDPTLERDDVIRTINQAKGALAGVERSESSARA